MRGSPQVRWLLAIVGACARPRAVARLACACAALAVAGAAAAFDPRSARFHHFDREDGLSQVTILAMAQDRSGRMWFGTQDGLNRYDGLDVAVYRPDPMRGGPSDGWVGALRVDADGALWVGTNNGVDRYDAERDAFVAFRHAADDPHSIGGNLIGALHVDRERRLWVAHDRGVSRWRPQTQDFERFDVPPLAPGGDAAAVRVHALADGPAGRLWLGTTDGLLLLDPADGSLETLHPPFAQARVNALLNDRRGHLWVGTDAHGLFRYDPAGRAWTRAADDPAAAAGEARVHALLEDRDGRLWVGSDAGAERVRDPAAAPFAFDRFRYQRYHRDGLGRGVVVSLLQTADGALWFGTWQAGASVLHEAFNRFLTFGPYQPATAALRDEAIRGLAADGDRLWLGSADGLFQFDVAQFHLREIDGTAGWFVNALAQWNGRLWVATRRGVRRVVPDTGAIDAATLPAGLSATRARVLHADRDRLWIAADGVGVHVLHTGQPPRLLPLAPSVAFIANYDADRVLVGAQDGLYWYASDGSTRLHVHGLRTDDAPGMPAAPVAFLRTRDGREWIATAGAGLLQLVLDDPAQPASARFVEALPRPSNASLDCMLEDDRGRLWISTDGGIVSYVPEPASSGSSHVTGTLREFDRDDGTLPGYFFSSIARLDDGHVALGGGYGFTLFDPSSIGPASAPPPPQLGALWLNNEPVAIGAPASPLQRALNATATLTLPAAQARSVGFDFFAPDLIAGRRLRFTHRLEPFDPDWVADGAQRRRATYTNLAPGHYVFEVRAGNADRVWAGQHAALQLVITPPWWATWWARAAFALLGIAALTALYRARVRMIERRRYALEAMVHQRTAELRSALDELTRTQHSLIEREKMASLGGLVAGVAHEINTPLGVALTASTHLQDQAQAFKAEADGGRITRSGLASFVALAEQSAEMIRRNLDRAARLVHNFKQVSVDRTSDGRRVFLLDALFDELVGSTHALWKHRPVTVTAHSEGRIELDSFPGPLGQVLLNLIQNALLHAFPDDAAGTIRIDAHAHGPDRVVIRVIDDGAGIAADALPHVFEPFYTTRRSRGSTGLGLHIAFNLVTQKLGGTIAVQSTPGQGTCVTIELPVRVEDA